MKKHIVGQVDTVAPFFQPLYTFLESDQPLYRYITDALTDRRRVQHKYECGAVCVVGGNQEMAGAPILSGLGALHAGAGWVKLCTHLAHAAYTNVVYPAFLVAAVPPVHEQRVWWQDLCVRHQPVIVLGPGLGRDDWAFACWETAVAALQDVRVIIDADALYFLSQRDSGARLFAGKGIVTPHPGEAATLLHTDVGAIQADREGAAQAIYAAYGLTVVLKGASTVVYDGVDTHICGLGSAALSKAGSGDVLSGVIAALWAGGEDCPFRAARAGVWLHAAAGEYAAATCGLRSVLPVQLAQAVGSVLQAIESKQDGQTAR